MWSPLFNLNNYYWNYHSAAYYLVGILTLLDGLFILAQNRKSLLNSAYALSCLAVSLWLTGMGMVFNSQKEAVALIWSRWYVFLGIIFITPSIYFFSVAWQKALFPELKIKKERIVIFNFLCGLGFYLFCLNSDLFLHGLWRQSWGFYPRAGKFYFVFLIWFFILMLMLLTNFINVYRKEKNLVKKQQAKLMIIAFSAAYLGSFEFLFNYGFNLYLLAFVPVFICITIIGYSVIRYRLMDIETVIHKTIAWFFTNLVLIIPFVILICFVQPWYLRLSNAGIIIFLASLLVFFLFFVRSFQPKVDHFFQRRRYNLEGILARFMDEVIHLKGISQLIELVQTTIANVLYPQKVDIFIYDEQEKAYKLANARKEAKSAIKFKKSDPFLCWMADNDQIAYTEFLEIDPAYNLIQKEARRYFTFTDSAVVIPLVLNRELLGVINLTKKSNLRRYTALDFGFLNILKNQSAIAISNSLVYGNIEAEVKRRTDELVSVQQQLIQAGKMATVGTLAGGVAHEINNPLAAILTNVQMLLASVDELDNEEAKESLALIEEATKRCRTIVKKLMAYARKPLESAEIAQIDLLEVVNKVMAFLEYQLKQENIRIVVKAEPEKYFVVGSQNEFEQVVTNIVLNAKDAIKRVKKGGDIEVSLVKNNGWVRLDIKDEGAGIPKEHVPKIFDPFFTTKDVGKGLGLGLSISQSIIEKYKGSIFFKSEEAQGTTFTVNLPQSG